MLRLLAFAAAGVAVAGSAQTPAPSQPQIDRNLIKLQVVLDRLGFSPGVIDGRRGMSLTAAIKGFQTARDLPVTGEPDAATMQALRPYWGTEGTKVLTLNERVLAGPYVNPIPKDEDQQARLPGLFYRSPLEKLAEMFHTTPQVLVALNSPQTYLRPGTKVEFPNVLPTSRSYDPKLEEGWRATLNMLNVDAVQPQAAKIVVDKSDKVLRAYDEGGRLVAQFQVTTGSEHDPLPLGTWKVNGSDYNPKFHFNPDLFWDAKKDADKAMLPPGPNGPVGVVWIDISKPHYGIHGTPEPALIGRTESHGCVRLANWNAARLAMMVKPGTPVIFQA
ncbi:peptidoglycan-binding protein [Sphingomonas metalli]|uniref:Peptidoglycan-binding protein n=1 Tax=Sphingomonas metalli TaxID=1779358 RepID=A0A916T9I2_9SPHN|nr:L,D-transpeptidase [Sphingomonas metalli]GGB34283.1 peptidoglycan-binding protein [Sphingomonas metalli]